MRRIVPDQFDPEFAAQPDGAFNTDGASHQLDQLFGNRQANAGPFLGAARLLSETIEWLKQMRQLFGRQSLAAVFNADADAFRGDRGAFHLDRSLFAVVFDRVGKQVDENLLQSCPVGFDKAGGIEQEEAH